MINNIKKIKDRIYNFDFSQSELADRTEIMDQNGVSEFIRAFKKVDMDKGIMIVPQGYTRGLFYSSSNGGEIYSSPKYWPDIVTFALNIFGLKKGAFYKLAIIGRNTGNSNFITDNRQVIITNEDRELLLDVNLLSAEDNTTFSTIFRSIDNETNLLFKIGKVFIKDIIIEEIEIIGDDKDSLEGSDTDLFEGKLSVVAYGVFTTESTQVDLYKGRYLQMTRYAGKGLSLYFDKNTNQYILERDNKEDTVGESFTNSNFVVDFNFNKLVNKGYFSKYNICDVSPEFSPNTLKQGSIRFEFVNDQGKTVEYANKNSRLTIIVYKIF